MEYNIIALRAGKCKEHTCLLGCKRTQGATQIHGQIIDFEVVENGPGTIIRESGGVDVILALVARLDELFEVDDWDEISSSKVLQKRHPLKRRIPHRIIFNVIVQIAE